MSILGTFKGLHEVLPSKTLGEALLFLTIAEQEGKTLTDYSRLTGMPLNKVSRYAFNLSSADLVILKENPKSRREKLCSLSYLGKRLSNKGF